MEITQKQDLDFPPGEASPDVRRPVRNLPGSLIFYSLLLIIALTAIPYGTVQPWWIAVFECAVFIVAILATLEALWGKQWSRTDLSLFAPLLLLNLFMLLQSLPLFSRMGTLGLGAALSADPFGTRLVAVRFFALIVVALLLLRYTTTKGRLRNLIYVIIAIGVVSAILGIMRKSTGAFLPGLTVIDRSFGQFVNRNHFAFLMEICLGLSLGMILGERGRPRRVLMFSVVSVLLWVGLIYSNSRGGILASLCQLLFLGVVFDPLRNFSPARPDTLSRRIQGLAGGFAVRVFLCLCLVGLFAFGVRWLGGEPVVFNFQQAATDFSQQEMQNNANTSRKEIWWATWQMIKAHPVVGIGFGAYAVGITRFHNASGAMTPQQAHNDYLEFIASGGIIACALLIWFLFLFIKRTRGRLRSPDPHYRAACLGALVGIFGVAVHSFVDFGIHITINALLLFALLVIALQNDSLAQSEPSAGPGWVGFPARPDLADID